MSDKVIRFRAGITDFDPVTKNCVPKSVQGTITIKPNEAEEELGFYDFEWVPVDVTAGNRYPEIKLILIPGETCWVPIESSPDGRFFALVFSSNEKYIFWLQEKNKESANLNDLTSKDKEIYDNMIKILSSSDEAMN
ncbi:hypothetical protein KAFR_0A05690 [Kazachstania africana CBS 2517]|uniref:Pru domain-containing protein n=1 Tax=Kazachstania africana (strain ATCC 22294 / BCRC 22015 / CBS 2517 / CECT 1963 / NBRC 1671 / NRRL Y-8276) TaxID=1071382 RepID=H2ANQ4_KAZAF|nr:hypothetical protein KAFR_0A05690 [Kazachstania africana CBS 2517]CCF56004.1 hypothetical protein KAFR_0A05690 [Kazachstania africana CBS 2517]